MNVVARCGRPATYGHDAGSMRHSPLTDITRGNVSRPAVAWTFHTDDVSDGRNRPAAASRPRRLSSTERSTSRRHPTASSPSIRKPAVSA